MMTSREVEDLVHRQIAGRLDRCNPDAVYLRRCLITPTLVSMDTREVVGDGIPARDTVVDVWLVFEDEPERKDGYKIVYCEDSEKFGLAMGDPAAGRLYYIGPYADFVTTS